MVEDEQNTSMEKREDEATDGDGVVTMKTHEKINEVVCMQMGIWL